LRQTQSAERPRKHGVDLIRIVKLMDAQWRWPKIVKASGKAHCKAHAAALAADFCSPIMRH
jgi:hypothetical protein